jgi:hypothetical protein
VRPVIYCPACPSPLESEDYQSTHPENSDDQLQRICVCFDGNFGLKLMRGAKDVPAAVTKPRHFFKADGNFENLESEYRNIRVTRSECGDSFRAGNEERNRAKTTNVVITGVFAALCARHGSPLTCYNFRGTGEKFVYGLAALDWVLKTFGPQVNCMYDVGCMFESFVKVSVGVCDLFTLNDCLCVNNCS